MWTNNFAERLPKGLLANTVVAFMSDHGDFKNTAWYSTLSGAADLFHPFMHLSVPTAFLEAHPEARAALVQNQDKLVTPYDFYKTLRALPVYPEVDADAGGPPLSDFHASIGVSLLHTRLPANRTCFDAGLPSCKCYPTGSQRVLGPQPRFIAWIADIIVPALNAVLGTYRDGPAGIEATAAGLLAPDWRCAPFDDDRFLLGTVLEEREDGGGGGEYPVTYELMAAYTLPPDARRQTPPSYSFRLRVDGPTAAPELVDIVQKTTYAAHIDACGLADDDAIRDLSRLCLC